VKPRERVLVPTGFKVEIPINYEIQVRPRSGLAIKHGISVLNSPGTVDSDYRGEIGVILINHGDTNFKINPFDRIAQIVVTQIIKVKIIKNNNLSDTQRGSGGFGSTGDRND
jgi:dUTP pyrophosphatase